MRIAAAALGSLMLLGGGASAAEMAVPPYVGSAACAGCHVEADALWDGSDHARAWMLPTPDAVLGAFDGAPVARNGTTTRFLRSADGFAVETDDIAGGRRTLPILGTAGVSPLQQYLVSPAPGQVQALDLAWDVEKGRWYHLYPHATDVAGDGLHWTGPYKNWDARCAECHATDYTRNFDPATGGHAPREAEIGVGCEACHGPGAAHLAWAEAPSEFRPRWPGLTPVGLTVDLGASAEAEIQQCAGCHSRREAFADGNPVPGTPYHDAYALSLLRPGTYHPDGSILMEDYEYGSFLQAKMYARGVRCSDCHEPHGSELRAEGNAVCTQCHSLAGNERFPTLRLADYDDPAHHFHEPGSDGAQCRNCHMIERTYMGIDARRDHSFRVPRPDLAATGAPDACTDCHADRDPGWAAAAIAERFPDPRHRGAHFATAFAAARWDPAAQTDALVALALDPEAAGIVRATALELLTPATSAALADRTLPLLEDADPLVRAAAAGLQRGAPADGLADRLLPVLGDRNRSVRVAAAKALLGVPATGGPEAERALRAAMREWQATLLTRLDFPETHLQAGGAALAMRDLASADRAFREAVALDPQLVDGWAMIARIQAATGDVAAAGAALDDALAANPADPTLLQLWQELAGAR